MTGGPGGSGVDTVRGAGSVLLENFGGNYNIIGFDPRGVNNSGPTLTCFPEDPETRSLFNLRISGIHNVPAGERYQQARAYGERCSRVNADSAAKYVGTSAVAQDLKHFIELSAVDKGQKAEDAKFYYYGVSYGTVIGQTIAAMYPDKIERMMLDGNVYAEEYYQGNVRSSIGDTDDTVRSFFTYCAEAGPEKCVFASENATADDLEARYKNILQKLEDEPLVISGLDQPLPGIVTRPNLEAFTFRNTYRPRTQFPLLAKVFSEIDIGNSSTYNLAQSGGGAAAIGLEEDSGYYSDVPNPDYAMSEALGLITCVDVAGRYKVTRQDYIRLYRELKESSYYGGGPMSMGNALACAGFEINPPESQYFPGKCPSSPMSLFQRACNTNFT
jgi:pimeloyl-ACP methyl ester carboxylesterase